MPYICALGGWGDKAVSVIQEFKEHSTPFRLIYICVLIANITEDILETITLFYLSDNWQVLKSDFSAMFKFHMNSLPKNTLHVRNYNLSASK